MKAKGASKESQPKAKKASTTGTMRAAPVRPKAATTGTQKASTTATRKAVTTTAARKAASTTATRRAVAPPGSPSEKPKKAGTSRPKKDAAVASPAASPPMVSATMVDASLPGFAAEKTPGTAAAATQEIAPARRDAPPKPSRKPKPKAAAVAETAPNVVVPAVAPESRLTPAAGAVAAEILAPAAEPVSVTGGAETPLLAGGPDVLTMASSSGRLKTFVKAARDAGLAATLGAPGPFTVFAPSDRAFAKLSSGDLEALLRDKPRLVAVLRRHVVNGLVRVRAGSTLGARALDGSTLAITSENDAFQVNGARVVQMNVRASNGVIHVIDRVLMPR